MLCGRPGGIAIFSRTTRRSPGVTRAANWGIEITEAIQIHIDGPVATITINRPERLNAIDLPAWKAIADAATNLAEYPAVRCVVLRGAGKKAFSSGADIKDFEAHRFDSRSAAEYAEVFEGALLRIEEMPQPTISMIQGVCVGRRPGTCRGHGYPHRREGLAFWRAGGEDRDSGRVE